MQAVRLPVLVSYDTILVKCRGAVTVNSKSFGSVRIGFGGVNIFDRSISRCIWEVTGSIIFLGRANLGHGTKVSCSGVLTFGSDFKVSAETVIIAHNSIFFGDNVLISWGCLFMDTDFHNIYCSKTKKILNISRPIVIGNDVWFGCDCKILKGTNVGNSNVIGSGSLLKKSYESTNSIIAGNPARVVKDDIFWVR